jgi:serine-type D-Ala-D-Ala carboxypeptidase/endopeptidase (penicillin-binding protein 4)
MLELMPKARFAPAIGVLAFFGQMFGSNNVNLDRLQPLAWQESAIFQIDRQTDPEVEKIVTKYLQELQSRGFDRNLQGIWIQSDLTVISNHRGNIPVSAASLSKIATTLAVLQKFGANYQFTTEVYHTGTIVNGTLDGDLIIKGGSDPLFVWEEAIELGNALNKLGIRQVKGNLQIIGNFYLNFKQEVPKNGELFKLAIDSTAWTPLIQKAYALMPKGTGKPQVKIAGNVVVKLNFPDNTQLLLKHQSLKLTEIVRQMNIYSNNEMAEMLAKSAGGAKIVAEIAAKTANVPQTEIQMINGSGLTTKNLISPRAATSMFIALERIFKAQSLTIADFFPTAGRDKVGTMETRKMPDGVSIKTGTLNAVSALSGVFATKGRGQVWFTIINHGGDVLEFRSQQDKFLQNLAKHWQFAPNFSPIDNPYLGDPQRNLAIRK